MISVATVTFFEYTSGMGRPKQKPEHYRGVYVRVRVTQTERAEILRRARESKAKNESTWIRERLLGDEQ